MIIGDNRRAVIENIKSKAESGDFHTKVELNDPVLTQEQSNAIVNGFLENRNKASFRCKAFLARAMANGLTYALNRDTKIIGIEKLQSIKGGAIITSNHFSPVENTVIRLLIKRLGKKRINIVSQETNLAMPGIFGFLMNYADVIPLSPNIKYMNHGFVSVLEELLQKNEYILIYPEQEMWFNYRKPRPFKRGPYFYAAKFNVPVISCFVEMQDKKQMDTDEFRKVKFVLHVLDVLYPDREKSNKENSKEMCERDYELKKTSYEKIYGKPLSYTFESSDIAGWTGTLDE